MNANLSFFIVRDIMFLVEKTTTPFIFDKSFLYVLPIKIARKARFFVFYIDFFYFVLYNYYRVGLLETMAPFCFVERSL
jgi:hypothetical protein